MSVNKLINKEFYMFSKIKEDLEKTFNIVVSIRKTQFGLDRKKSKKRRIKNWRRR